MELSRGKKILFYGIAICLVWITVECLSWGACRLRYEPLSVLENERADIIAAHEQESQGRPAHTNQKNWNVIHPYLGFVTEGLDRNRKCPDQGFCDQRARTYEDRPFIQSTEDNLIVAVIGGSFAAGVSYGSGPGFLKAQLKQIPIFKDKDIFIYHLAPGGYKQPQQLLKINYFLSLGAEFDLIINIDGFNEIALPGVENLSKGVHPIFPRSWYYYVDSALNPELLALYGKKENYKLAQLHWAKFFSKPFLRFLPSANFLWKFQNNRLASKVKLADVALVEYQENKERKLQYATTGPDYYFRSWNAFYQDLAEIWARGSFLLYNICQGQGIEYFHFLQPNQYVEGSKPMSEKERKTALLSDSKAGNAARRGYPFLVKKGKWLKQKGIPFYDLTMIFSDNSDQLYIDNCCHLNMHGYRLVAKQIAQRIKEHENRL